MSDIFSSTNLHDSLMLALAAIPPGKSQALVIDGTYAETDGASIRAVWLKRAPNGWNVAMSGAYDGADGISGKVAVAKSW